MIKTILLLFACHLLNSNVAVSGQHCYTCTGDTCASSDFVACSSANKSTNGQSFVHAATNLGTQDSVYTELETAYKNYATQTVGLNESSVLEWKDITQWVCYVTKSKQHGCLIMGKGLCKKERTWLESLKDVGAKLVTIMNQVKEGATAMFGVKTPSMTEDQKLNISNWMAANYLGKLVNGSNDAQYQLDYCCEGDKCNNFASMGPKSTVLLIFLFPLFLAFIQ